MSVIAGLWERFLGWVRRLLGTETSRDVSRIAGDQASLSLTREVVRLHDGPLKAGRRRLVHRDPRLVPKAARSRLGRKVKLLSHDEASRRFSATLRTRNRQISDLIADPVQLQRLGLPAFADEAALAAALGQTVKGLRHLSLHRQDDGIDHYVAFTVPKRSGGERLILAPKRRLKAVLRRLNTLLVQKLPVHDAAHGFRKGRSVKSGAAPHVGKAVVIHLDLEDFFHQVNWRRVRGFLLAVGYSYPVAATLAVLTTASVRQPVSLEGGRRVFVPVGERVTVQGAPTSPGLCNSIAARLDRRLSGLARSKGFQYTRYADDLCFSGDRVDAAKGLIAATRRICEDEGFPLNGKKTRIMRRGAAQTVTGVTVNRVLGLSRQQRRKIRAALHQGRSCTGELAWVVMLNAEQAAVLRRAPRRKAVEDAE